MEDPRRMIENFLSAFRWSNQSLACVQTHTHTNDDIAIGTGVCAVCLYVLFAGNSSFRLAALVLRVEIIGQLYL